MAGIKLDTPAGTSPITLQQAKDHMYVTISEDDTLIQSMIDTATTQTQNYTGLQLVDATYVQSLDAWQDTIELLRNPVKSITSIKYYDEDDVLQTLTATDFILDNFSIPNKLIKDVDATLPSLKSKPNAVEIEFIAGYTDIPEPLKTYIKMTTSTFYENREEFNISKSNELPNRFSIRLLDTYKVSYV
jgi:uncharacterized phiE125 gp8 family phage protein